MVHAGNSAPTEEVPTFQVVMLKMAENLGFFHLEKVDGV